VEVVRQDRQRIRVVARDDCNVLLYFAVPVAFDGDTVAVRINLSLPPLPATALSLVVVAYKFS
jgi:hypothetical protein